MTSIATANGMHFFVTGGAGGEVRVWDVRTRGMISTLKEHASRVVGLAVLDDDTHVVSASRDRSIITWDLIRERRVSQHQQRVGGINDFALAQGLDKVYMVSVGQDRSLSFWDIMQSQPLQIVLGAHVQECTCVALSRDGVLATGSADQTVKLWDFGTGDCSPPNTRTADPCEASHSARTEGRSCREETTGSSWCGTSTRRGREKARRARGGGRFWDD